MSFHGNEEISFGRVDIGKIGVRETTPALVRRRRGNPKHLRKTVPDKGQVETFSPPEVRLTRTFLVLQITWVLSLKHHSRNFAARESLLPSLCLVLQPLLVGKEQNVSPYSCQIPMSISQPSAPLLSVSEPH